MFSETAVKEWVKGVERGNKELEGKPESPVGVNLDLPIGYSNGYKARSIEVTLTPRQAAGLRAVYDGLTVEEATFQGTLGSRVHVKLPAHVVQWLGDQVADSIGL